MFARPWAGFWNSLHKIADHFDIFPYMNKAEYNHWAAKEQLRREMELRLMSDQANEYNKRVMGAMKAPDNGAQNSTNEYVYREATQKLTFTYKNWRGVIREYTVIPIEFRFGHDHYHKEDQWLLDAYDLPRGVRRTFTFNNMLTPPRSENAK